MNEMLANKKNNLNSKIHVEFSNDIFEIPYDENEKIFQLKFYFKNNKYKIQFWISFCIAIFSCFLFLFNYFTSHRQEQISKKLLNNYNLTTLYQKDLSNIENSSNAIPFVIGMLQIDKINLCYPILSEVSDDLLKISICRFTGPMPNEIGNLCIVGHNYIDNRFFSRLNELQINDQINIYDLSGNKMVYQIFEKYEVLYNDTNCINQNTANKKIVTLITCNNLDNLKRLIIKAK